MDWFLHDNGLHHETVKHNYRTFSKSIILISLDYFYETVYQRYYNENMKMMKQTHQMVT